KIRKTAEKINLLFIFNDQYILLMYPDTATLPDKKCAALILSQFNCKPFGLSIFLNLMIFMSRIVLFYFYGFLLII
ncbi:hypothetical protein, partial [Acinetobacter bouvetii]|uniref:hypothetical protein n=1 Tax=Acinetobacter bouvetii TaxID=202951 RepID=UPI001BC88942